MSQVFSWVFFFLAKRLILLKHFNDH
jgi:hypothetical protein